MYRWSSRVMRVLLLFVLTASTVDAQRRARRRAIVNTGPAYGAHVGYNFDSDDMLLGAQLSWPIMPSLELYPSFDYYFVDPGSAWALNFDVKYRPPTRYRSWYLGGGLNYLKVSGGSDTNLNLLTGFESRRGRTRPYVEAKLTLGDADIFQLVLGLAWR